MSFFRNPERWARQGAGPTWRWVTIVLHFILCVLTMLLILFPFRHLSPIAPFRLLPGGMALLYVGVVMPAMYLYTISRLLKRIDDLEKGQPPHTSPGEAIIEVLLKRIDDLEKRLS